MAVKVLIDRDVILTGLYSKEAEEALELICNTMNPAMLVNCYSIVFKSWCFRTYNGEIALSLCTGGLLTNSSIDLQPNPCYRDNAMTENLSLENLKDVLRKFLRKRFDDSNEVVKNAKIICKELMIKEEKQSEKFKALAGNQFDPFVSNALYNMFHEMNSLLSKSFGESKDNAKERLQKIENIRDSIEKVLEKALSVSEKSKAV